MKGSINTNRGKRLLEIIKFFNWKQTDMAKYLEVNDATVLSMVRGKDIKVAYYDKMNKVCDRAEDYIRGKIKSHLPENTELWDSYKKQVKLAAKAWLSEVKR